MSVRIIVTCLALAMAAGCGGGSSGGSSGGGKEPGSGSGISLTSDVLQNATAYVPAQCYTRTEDEDGSVVNTCYTCHLAGQEPNYIDDTDFQLEYTMASGALTNPWTNLFEDRGERIAAISDADVRSHVREDNYRDADGSITLARRLAEPPQGWDYDRDGEWAGYVPDCHFDFDVAGFDRDGNGAATGWRSFAYYPFPATHWPTNGSMGDVAIRLGEAFRQNDAGVFDLTTYTVNLAIVEALIKRRDVTIDPVDENDFGVDLDRNGVLETASVVRYGWAPLQGITMSYVGKARGALDAGEVHLAAGLYPEGTEFIQSLRYLDEQADGTVGMATRMKELRYGKKYVWRDYATLREVALEEVKDKDDFPDRTRLFVGDVEQGVYNADSGWGFQGFIEDEAGDLRPQTFEETAYCMGCHGGIGATTDSTFAFGRKLDGDNWRRGWYHWSQRGLTGLNEPKVEVDGAGVHYEYTYYLMYTKSGDELRSNAELRDRFFDAAGQIRSSAIDALHDDVSSALLPSAERALALNKAYWTIVRDQDFTEGREVLVDPADKVWEDLEPEQPTGVDQATDLEAFGGTYGPTAASDQPDPELDAFGTRVLGVGMGGPDGAHYEVDWQGVIHKSRYQLSIEGVTFTFPSRLTLPTREILALRNIPVCYDCHRMRSPVVDGDRQTTLPPDYPATTNTSEEDAVLTRLTTDAGHDSGAEWSPDGTTIAFVSDRSGTDQIWLMDADGTDQRLLTTGPAKHAWPKWRHDSQRLLCWAHENGEHSIIAIDADGTDEITVVKSSQYLDSAAWRPDGDYIAYSAIDGGNWDLWLATADGSQRWRLTTEDAMETNPRWSPTGDTITYKVAAGGEYSLTFQNFMTFENGFDQPTIHVWDGPEAIQANDYSPGGGEIAYTAEIISGASGADRVSYANMISTVELVNGKAVATTSVVLSKGRTLGDRGAVFSPDGTKVAFWAWDRNYRATLWLYEKATDTVRPLTTSGFDMVPRWSPDGTRLVFESYRSGNQDLWVIDLD